MTCIEDTFTFILPVLSSAVVELEFQLKFLFDFNIPVKKLILYRPTVNNILIWAFWNRF